MGDIIYSCFCFNVPASFLITEPAEKYPVFIDTQLLSHVHMCYL